ncbi:MAG: energy transducer TonB [Pseudomonadota bacterium]
MQFPDDIDRASETARPAGLATQTVRRSRSRVVMWSVLFHAIAIAALWAVLAGDPPQIRDETPIIAVDLVALAQSAPAAPAGPPGPVQPDAPPTVQPVVPQPAAPTPPVVQREERPAPKPRVEPKPAPAPVPRAEDRPTAPRTPAPVPTPIPGESAQPSPTQAPAQPNSGSTAPQRSAGGGIGAGQSDANASAVAKASYARLLLTRLQRAIVYPRRAQRRDIQGIVRVEVVLAASGALKTVRLVGASGSDILDEAALELVRRVAPFPAVPRELSPRGQDFAFVAPIQYRLN